MISNILICICFCVIIALDTVLILWIKAISDELKSLHTYVNKMDFEFDDFKNMHEDTGK